jgi:hypothetical protein
MPTTPLPRRARRSARSATFTASFALAVCTLVGAISVTPAAAKSSANTPRPLGTIFAFPDSGGSTVEVALVRVVTNAPPLKHYFGLHGKGPAVALEFYVKNTSKVPAPLTLFSSVLYYAHSVAGLTGTIGATKLGPLLNELTSLPPGAHREGWVTGQANKGRILKVQSTLNGSSTGTWKV